MRKTILVSILLAAATLIFRLPLLLDSRTVNSDAAITGLQAMHLLHGEVSLFLWGRGYQSSLDSIFTAGAFAIFGATPAALKLVPILGQVILTLLAFFILKKRVGLSAAAILVLPVVFTTWPPLATIVYATRQSCVVAIFISIWALDRAAENKRSLFWFAAGAFCFIAAIILDVFAIGFLPGLATLAATCVMDSPSDRHTKIRRSISCATGAIIGLVLFGLTRLDPHAQAWQAGLSLDRLDFNLHLLMRNCLPLTLGIGVLSDNENPFLRTLHAAPMPWNILQIIGGGSLLVGFFISAIKTLGQMSWRVRRLGIFALLTIAATIGEFLFSRMPVDLWSSRYLAPLIWMTPFALAPLTKFLDSRKLALALAPFLLTAAIGGWLSNTADTAQSRQEDQSLQQFLQSHQVRYASADYWLAYRLTFLWRENPVLVPLDVEDDRYSPYRDEFLKQGETALIFHPLRSRQSAEYYEKLLNTNRIRFERFEIGRYTVLLVHRRPDLSAATAKP